MVLDAPTPRRGGPAHHANRRRVPRRHPRRHAPPGARRAERVQRDTTISGCRRGRRSLGATVYKAFGSKAALAKRLYDVTLVGDEEPVPLAESAEIQAIIGEPNPRQKLAMYAALGRKLVE